MTENKKLKEELAKANQLKNMYHTYYRAKHDDIQGIIFKQKEKLEKIEKVILRCKEANCTNCEYQDKCNFNGDDFDDYILRIIRGAEDE